MKIFGRFTKKDDDEDPYSQSGHSSHSGQRSGSRKSREKSNTENTDSKNAGDRPRTWLWSKYRPGKQGNGIPLTENTRRMLDGMRSLQDISAKEIMIPRIDVDFLDKSSSTEGLELALSRSNHSRFPVYEETTDKIVGILYAKDLIPYWVEKKQFDVAEICRKPYFVPESMKVDSLLAEFQRRHVHIAMVVDEYGGISGIVCLEDILEEIVGDIQDEFDQETEDIITLEEGVHVCDARLNISNLNEELNLALPTDDCDTIGGFVFSRLGKIPSRYERVCYENAEFVVQKLEGHRIESVKVILHEAESSEERESENPASE
ncbi:hemolysin family protein [Candidatus Haliotispira prima]|uniref:Hemolysin family protein n=1 Tax=Candidatus Haliotispira prima TaxID=3034016 RepID=A0ABY8MH95_9SPIO|nr:hemolysin family protein [Candidatus Haliotispira prima]